MFVVELCRLLERAKTVVVDQGVIRVAGDLQSHKDKSIGNIIRSRLDQCSHGCRMALKVAANIGMEVSLELMEAAYPWNAEAGLVEIYIDEGLD